MNKAVGVSGLAAAAAGCAGYSNVAHWGEGYPLPFGSARLERRAPGFVNGAFLTFNSAIHTDVRDGDDGAKRMQAREGVD